MKKEDVSDLLSFVVDGIIGLIIGILIFIPLNYFVIFPKLNLENVKIIYAITILIGIILVLILVLILDKLRFKSNI